MANDFRFAISRMKRDPKSNPIAGDSFTFSGWTIVVLGREGDSVLYTAVKGEQSKRSHQTIEEWRSWSHRATVAAKGGIAECIISQCASGPCVGCTKYVKKDAHLSDEGIKCNECCGPCRNRKVAKNVKAK